jgi:hypothetical protein
MAHNTHLNQMHICLARENGGNHNRWGNKSVGRTIILTARKWNRKRNFVKI